jgi:hypothetical protein
MGTISNHGLFLMTNSTERLTISAAGNVGIGTATPGDKFTVEVAANKRINVGVVSSSVIADFSTGATGIQFSRPNDGADSLNSIFTYNDASSNTNFAFAARNDLVFAAGGGSTYQNSPERMRIKANGNVGIGTTNPAYKLDVVGSGFVGYHTANATNADFNVSGGSSSSDSIINLGYHQTFDATVWRISRMGSDNQNFRISNWGSGSEVNVFTSTGGGDIGIGGATSPGARLDVDGGHIQIDVSKTITINDDDTFTYDSDTMTHYGLGWFSDSWQGGGSTAWLSGYSGVKLFSAALPRLTVDISGNVAVTGLVSCGGIQTNGSGVMSCTSDERLKDVQDEFTTGLAGIRGINPQTYSWKDGTDYYDGGIEYSGFLAQNVGANIPEAMGEGANGFKQINTTTILAASVNAIKELDIRTLALAPAAENAEAHSLAVSSDASVAGMLTVTGIGTFSDSLAAASILTEGSVTAFSFLTETNETLPNEVLTGGNADLFKMASYAITGIQALSERTDLIVVRIDEIDARVTALENGSTADEISGAVGLTVATIKSALQTLGIYLENGVATFETLVFRQLAVAKDTNGDSSAGSETILAGNTVVEVENPYVLPTSKIFVTFTGSIQGAWYISNKEEGKFRVTLATGQSADVSFDYFILQTEGQLASPGAAAPIQTPNDPAPSNDPLPPVFPGEGTGTTTPVMGSGDTTPPSITLNGPAAREIDQGATWIDQGATALDETDGDLTSSIQVQGTVDTGTPGTYTVSYSVSDAAGNEAHVSRIVSVQVVSEPAPSPEPAPEPAPSPEPAPAP